MVASATRRSATDARSRARTRNRSASWRILGPGGANGRLRLLQHPLCRRGLRSRALELGSPRLALGRKPGGEGFELVHPRPHGVDVAREPVEIRERGGGLLVGALELPQDREDPFGH